MALALTRSPKTSLQLPKLCSLVSIISRPLVATGRYSDPKPPCSTKVAPIQAADVFATYPYSCGAVCPVENRHEYRIARGLRNGNGDPLPCNDAAATRSNPHLCGALVNYDLPSNPTRRE